MLDAHYLVWLVVFLALAFDYINGFHDTANAIATSVSTRAIDLKGINDDRCSQFFGCNG
mgnify:CR=1 FL=1